MTSEFDILFNLIGSIFKKDFPFPEDKDRHRRQCRVCLVTRDIGEGFATHWALTFDWGDYMATYEANDDGGYLVPTWTKGPPAGDFCWSESERARVVCSPREVNRKAKGIAMNGHPYILTKNNCHMWAIDLGKQLGISISMPLERRLPPNLTNIIDFGYALKQITGTGSDCSSLKLSSNSLKK